MAEQPADPLLTAAADGDEHAEEPVGEAAGEAAEQAAEEAAGEAAEAPAERPAAAGCGGKGAAVAVAVVAALAAAGLVAWSAAPASVRRGAVEEASEMLRPARHMLQPSRAMEAPRPRRAPSGSGSQVEVQFFWLGDLARCVGVDGGLEAAESGGSLVLTSCAEGPLGFLMPSEGDLLLRVAEKPGLCVDHPSNTSKLYLSSCSEAGDAATSTRFFLQASAGNRSTGSVRDVDNASSCMGSAEGTVGAPVEMHECTDNVSQLFMLNLVIEGSLLGSALDPASSRSEASQRQPGANVVAEAEAEAKAAALSAWARAAAATQGAAGAARRFAEDSLELAGQGWRELPAASALLWSAAERAARNWTGGRR